jgi:hypothetical protein
VSLSLSLGTVALWSFGNHKLGPGRSGVNDPVAFQNFFEGNICPVMRENESRYTGSVGPADRCSVWWLSTHYRFQQHFPDESPDAVRSYNLGMRDYFDAKKCGNVNYIDVYNMTARLTTEHRDEADQLTHDKVHWGYEVNLVKAQIVLNALIAAY